MRRAQLAIRAGGPSSGRPSGPRWPSALAAIARHLAATAEALRHGARQKEIDGASGRDITTEREDL